MHILINLATVQITQNLNGTCVSHVSDMHRVNYTCVGFLDSTRVYVHAHAVFTHVRVFTCVYACMANAASYLATVQITHNLNDTHMSYACHMRVQKQKTHVASNHACTLV